MIQKGYTKDSIKSYPCTLVFGEHEKPVLTPASAAALFQKFLNIDNIAPEDVCLRKFDALEFFFMSCKLSWFYQGYYIEINFKPKYGYVGQETSCSSSLSETTEMDLGYSLVHKYLRLVFKLEPKELIATQMHVGLTHKTVLRNYPADVSEDELIADCLKFRKDYDISD